MKQTQIRSRRDRDIATLADCLMQLLDVAVAQGDTPESSATELADVYNDVKPKLEQLLRESRHGRQPQVSQIRKVTED